MTTSLARDPFADLLRFYTQALGCRLTEDAVGDRLPMSLHGRTIVLERHADVSIGASSVTVCLPEDGLVLGVDDWCDIEERLRQHRVPSCISVPRPLGTGPGQQCIMEVHDPLGNRIVLRGFSESQATLAA